MPEVAASGQSDSWRREVVGLWRRRVRRPTSNPVSVTRGREGYPWVYPFCIPERLCEEHGLRSVQGRLLRELSARAAEYAELAERAPGSDEAEETQRALASAVWCLRVWGLTRDRADDQWYGVGLNVRAQPDMSAWTKGGRRRNPYFNR